jgi:glycosyltransferase involved in cell wall biosynthesis
MKAVPEVSVVLPTFNRLNYLSAAVDSVCVQSFRDWELIIADDGSAEATTTFLAALADPRIRVLLLQHSGNPATVRNAALREARGRFVAFIDSDDLWLPQKLERQLAAMAASPQRRWSYTSIRRIDEVGNDASQEHVKPWRAWEGSVIEPLLKLQALVAVPTVIAERALVLEAGAFDEQQRFAEDYDLWLRLAMRSEVSVLREPLACVRVHTDNYSQDRIGAYEAWVRLYSKMSRLVETPHLKSVCRERRAYNALTLASMYSQARRHRLAVRSLMTASSAGWSKSWWWSRMPRVWVKVILRAAGRPSHPGALH